MQLSNWVRLLPWLGIVIRPWLWMRLWIRLWLGYDSEEGCILVWESRVSRECNQFRVWSIKNPKSWQSSTSSIMIQLKSITCMRMSTFEFDKWMGSGEKLGKSELKVLVSITTRVWNTYERCVDASENGQCVKEARFVWFIFR